MAQTRTILTACGREQNKKRSTDREKDGAWTEIWTSVRRDRCIYHATRHTRSERNESQTFYHWQCIFYLQRYTACFFIYELVLARIRQTSCTSHYRPHMFSNIPLIYCMRGLLDFLFIFSAYFWKCRRLSHAKFLRIYNSSRRCGENERACRIWGMPVSADGKPSTIPLMVHGCPIL